MLTILILTYISIFGAVIGSFLNMLIYRLPRNGTIIWKRSSCLHCGHPLGLADLVPVLSYVLLLGKCRYCQKKIPLRYLWVELTMVVSLPLFWIVFGPSWMFLKYSLFTSGMTLLFFTDWETQLLPDSVTLSLIGIGAIEHLLLRQWKELLFGILIGGGIFLAISLIAKPFYKKDVLGFGDVKLGGAIGAFWGLKISVMTLYFSFLIGGSAGLLLIFAKKKKRTDYIPFGPSIIIGWAVAAIFGNAIWKWYLG